MRRFGTSERILAENAFHEMTIRACQLVKGTYMCTGAESATPKIHQLFNSNFLPSGNLRFPLLPAPCSGCRGGETRVNHKGSATIPPSVLLSIQNRIYDMHSHRQSLRLKNTLDLFHSR